MSTNLINYSWKYKIFNMTDIDDNYETNGIYGDNSYLYVSIGLGTIISCYCIYKKWINRRRRQEIENLHNNSESSVSMLSVFEQDFIPINTDLLMNSLNNFILAIDKEDNCPICLDELQRNEIVSVLNCGHFYHKDCLFKWIDQKKYKCPVCRDAVFSNIILIP